MLWRRRNCVLLDQRQKGGRREGTSKLGQSSGEDSETKTTEETEDGEKKDEDGEKRMMPKKKTDESDADGGVAVTGIRKILQRFPSLIFYFIQNPYCIPCFPFQTFCRLSGK
uniref:Uncharacterized protein n=1 Tax=Meloidogyne hapla TaxID=6305 RepID=A0A1I8BJT6_MELHA